MADLAELGRSRVPEMQTEGRRAKIRRKHEPVRLRRLRIQASALRDGEGQLLTDAGSIGAELCGHGGLVFADIGADSDEEAMAEEFLGFAVAVPWAEEAPETTDSCPRLDGLPHMAWRHAPRWTWDASSPVARRMTDGADGTRVLGESVTDCVPKAEVHDEAIVAMRASEARPLTMMQASSKIVAVAANSHLGGVAQATVAGQQQGFLCGMGEGCQRLELGAGVVEAGVAAPRTSSAILLDFVSLTRADLGWRSLRSHCKEPENWASRLSSVTTRLTTLQREFVYSSLE